MLLKYVLWFWISFVDQPTIENKPQAIVNESEKVFLSRNISSNPLSNASWYDGNNLLKTQVSARAANYILVRASCEDTKNFSLVVSNGIGNAVNTLVGLIVNCEYNYIFTKFKRHPEYI